MADITVPQTEYDKLTRQAKAYRSLAAHIFEGMLQGPIEDIVADFREIGLYSEEFIHDLESGLRKSSHQPNK